MTEHRFYTGPWSIWRRTRPEGVTPVRISVGEPSFLRPDELARIPSLEILSGRGLLWPPISHDHFEQAYRATLNKTGVPRIGRELAALHRRHDRPVLLLSFEGPHDHRRLFADWWLDRTGEPIPEFAGWHRSSIVVDDGMPVDDPERQLSLAFA